MDVNPIIHHNTSYLHISFFFNPYISHLLAIMAQRFQLNPKPLTEPPADPLKRVSLIPRSAEQKLADNLGERRPLAPRTHEDKSFGDQSDGLQHPHVAAEHNKLMDHETDKIGSMVPKSAHNPHSSEDLIDANSRHSLVPRSLGPNSLGGRFGPGKKQAFHRNGRPIFSLSDDRVMADRVLKTHSPDMIFFDVKSLLSVVDDIFKSHVPSIDSSAPKVLFLALQLITILKKIDLQVFKFKLL